MVFSFISMMSLSYVKKHFIVCYFVLFLVINAVAENSLDYYFGNDKPLHSVGNILVKDCAAAAIRYQCYQKCGAYHACLLGQCICVTVRASPKEDEDLTEQESSVEDTKEEEFFDTDEDALESHEDLTEEESSVEDTTAEEFFDTDEEDALESHEDLTEEESSVEDTTAKEFFDTDEEDALESHEDLTEEESSVEDTTAEEFFDTDEEDALESQSNEESSNSDEELIEQSALRHHIAHFCPNLEVARACIRKCMKLGLPAFCGKNHACYCGHRYDHPGKDPEIDPDIVHNQFKDLYEKYFGPESSEEKAPSKH